LQQIHFYIYIYIYYYYYYYYRKKVIIYKRTVYGTCHTLEMSCRFMQVISWFRPPQKCIVDDLSPVKQFRYSNASRHVIWCHDTTSRVTLWIVSRDPEHLFVLRSS